MILQVFPARGGEGQMAEQAAQYVRMSTDHQQYSTANQKAAIAAYAAARDIEIVATYEDAGKSGLTLSGRPALRQLISDVAAGQSVFGTVLVYDVSRWGRFQDADESAHLEYLCRLAGVQIVYCAEPFPNDGTPFASICKVVKRALAAEYSRELSEKVFIGKRRLIGLGFRQGGSAGIGLRRCLIDASGNRKGILAHGERKSIATDRVILVPGPPDEVAIVQRIYRDYLERDMGTMAIAAALNREGVRSESGRPWSIAVVKRVLISEKYVGDSVWGRTSFKLQIARTHNTPETWARADQAFEGIVGRSVFERAQRVRAARAEKLTDEQIVGRLRSLLKKNSIITARLIKRDRFVSVAAVRKRFGSLITAYALAGYQPTRDLEFLARDRAARRLRDRTVDALLHGCRARGQSIERLPGDLFLINGEITASLTVAQQRRSQQRNPRWLVKPCEGDDDLRIAVLKDGHHERAHSYYLFPAGELRSERTLSLRNPADVEAFRSDSLDRFFEVCMRRELQPPDALQEEPDGFPQRAPQRPLAVTRRLLVQGVKTYSRAFLRASAHMRSAVKRAHTARTRVNALRKTLARLLTNEELFCLLITEGIPGVPSATYWRENYLVEGEERRFRDNLRRAALDLWSSGVATPRTMQLLRKLTPQRRLEATEIILLVNDYSDYLARALLAATPRAGFIERPRKHLSVTSSRVLEWMGEERVYIHREARRVLGSFGRDALDLVAVSSFGRRLTSSAAVVAWLEQHDREALRALSAGSDHQSL